MSGVYRYETLTDASLPLHLLSAALVSLVSLSFGTSFGSSLIVPAAFFSFNFFHDQVLCLFCTASLHECPQYFNWCFLRVFPHSQQLLPLPIFLGILLRWIWRDLNPRPTKSQIKLLHSISPVIGGAPFDTDVTIHSIIIEWTTTIFPVV